jgi:hypothetical protein
VLLPSLLKALKAISARLQLLDRILEFLWSYGVTRFLAQICAQCFYGGMIKHVGHGEILGIKSLQLMIDLGQEQ